MSTRNITRKYLYHKLEQRMTDRLFLKKIGISRKKMTAELSRGNWEKKTVEIQQMEQCSCRKLLEIAKDTMDRFSREPEEGWLSYLYQKTILTLFPEWIEENGGMMPETEQKRQYLPAGFFYMELLRCVLELQEQKNGFSPVLHMDFPAEDEVKHCGARDEFSHFTRLFEDYYILEFMHLGKEITPYNTLGHICGVHFVAMYMARQLRQFSVPVDLALISGAAAGHDIGKYGCRGKDAKRTPYLHYYYTDQFLKRNHMPLLAHIASNHSTWDLELENLPVESLLLIYADFRVKSSREANGEERVHFYTLEEAFHVILNKLDNVDAAKTARYKKVYAKLKDFEDYMVHLGVHTDLKEHEAAQKQHKDTALMNAVEVIEQWKYLAIEHNINLMNTFNSEASFGNLLEAARSEKQWKRVRAYINVLEEYSTYMTKKQKQMTLHFLYDLLIHREGDIRRQAADLAGKIIVNYDDEYRKELPDGVSVSQEEMSSYKLWNFYLEKIIFPDHKMTEQHKRWLGYTLKIVLESAMACCREKEQTAYLGEFLQMFSRKDVDDSTAFILLDAVLAAPLALCRQEEWERMIRFTADVCTRDSLEIKIAALRAARYLTVEDAPEENSDIYSDLKEIEGCLSEENQIASSLYLRLKIRENLGMDDELAATDRKILYGNQEAVSDLFLENLKVGTPWVVKAVNIEFLLEEVKQGRMNEEILHVATHLSNLIKVSERVTVRHSAGNGLREVIGLLPLDQRNEVVIELTRGLEIGEYQFSKYIPEYLGALALYLHPNELDEFISNMGDFLEQTNEKVGSVALDTLGYLLRDYPQYRDRFAQSKEEYDRRERQLLGMLLRGLANYNEVVSQEAFLVIGQFIFGSTVLSLQRKFNVFRKIYKKMLTLIIDQKENDLTFFTNAAALNHIYRFLSEYSLQYGDFEIEHPQKIAFFPGTFDPFSLGHKGIVTTIRNQGFEVYLALDEFSWSKKTQPRMMRRKIITMSVADEDHVYIFPDDIPVNIANPKDLKHLKEVFAGKDLYIVVGSDVIVNASSYKAAPAQDSIHTLNHVVFKRQSLVEGDCESDDLTDAYRLISGKIVELTLPVHLEDISSTRIRENIDDNRDISYLIDPVAQNYIYDNSLYLREPQYKDIIETKAISFEPLASRGSGVLQDLLEEINPDMKQKNLLELYLQKDTVRTTLIRDGSNGNRVCALAAVNRVEAADLYRAFGSLELAAYLREKMTGTLMVIGDIFYSSRSSIRQLPQLILTETLAQALEEDVACAVYCSASGSALQKNMLATLKRQGFREIEIAGKGTGIYEVDMRSPAVVFRNMDTVLKAPFNKNEKILSVMDQAHMRMQNALTRLYPGNLILSIDGGVMHHKLVNMITRENGVPNYPTRIRNLGPYMCVPFGKILRGVAVPNTVTKTLHMEKMFSPDLKGFSIEEYPYYSPIENQIKTIHSFHRPVILVDDLLHKGYRMRELDPVLKENGVEVSKLMVGLLSGRGKDLMELQGRQVESAYFVSNLKTWFVESSLYPFIGGDGVKREDGSQSGILPAINLILPYTAPTFLHDVPKDAVYDFSMTCMKNAREIFLTMEEVYQNLFQRKLTLKRLSEMIISPRIPDGGSYMNYDMNLAPSGYLLNGIERLLRLENIIK